MNELMKTILHRRTIRRYEEKQIDEEALQLILQAGLYAPSAVVKALYLLFLKIKK